MMIIGSTPLLNGFPRLARAGALGLALLLLRRP